MRHYAGLTSPSLTLRRALLTPEGGRAHITINEDADDIDRMICLVASCGTLRISMGRKAYSESVGHFQASAHFG